MSKSDRWALLQGDFMDEREMIPEMQKTKNNLNLFAVYAAKAMLSYFNARFHESAAFAKEAEQYETAIGGLLPVTQPPFYGALARLKVMSDSTSEESDSYKRLTFMKKNYDFGVRRDIRIFSINTTWYGQKKHAFWGKTGMPPNCMKKPLPGQRKMNISMKRLCPVN